MLILSWILVSGLSPQKMKFVPLTPRTSARNGVQPTKQLEWGNWCNVIGTGFGRKPGPGDGGLLDQYVWIKPGGECDGTSNTSAVRYDAHCGSPDALKPAPEAGTWFQAYFEQLLTNAAF
jgi:cellulose 1,4-beta-cellobiosidase